MTAGLPPELVCGFPEMDAQHRTVLQLLERAASTAGQADAAATRAAVSALQDELVAHFDAEESYMSASGYAERARHKGAHDLFLQDLARLVEDLAAGRSAGVAQALSGRVAEWIRFHIRVNDVPLGRFLVARRFRVPTGTTPHKARPS